MNIKIKRKMKYYFVSIIFCFNSFWIQAQVIDCPKPVIVGNPNEGNYQVIYPLGWSEKGDFSYIHQDINAFAGGGGFKYNFIVQNMKSDKILFKKNMYYNPEDGYVWKPRSTKIDSLAYKKGAYFDHAFFKTITWNKNRHLILDVLTNYKIKPTNLSLNNISKLQEKGITLDEKSNTVTSKNGTVVTDYKIKLFSKNIKEKIIYHWYCKQEKCSTNSPLLYRRFMVKGYFKSPFENRIAIIVFNENNGYGEIDEFPFAVGANLEKNRTY